MAALEHSVDIELSPDEAAREWASFPFRSMVGFFRTPGQRLHWRDSAGNEAWGVVLLIGMGRTRTRVHVSIDYFPVDQTTSGASVDAQVSADLTMFCRFTESDAARMAARERKSSAG